MIKVRVKGKPGRIEGFMLWGHARHAPHGADIVCAGVSAVVTTALLGLAKVAAGGFRYRILPQGLVYCRIEEARMTRAKARDAQVILDVMLLGLAAIKQSHEDCMDLIYTV